jgi:hypothetical protein
MELLALRFNLRFGLTANVCLGPQGTLDHVVLKPVVETGRGKGICAADFHVDAFGCVFLAEGLFDLLQERQQAKIVD